MSTLKVDTILKRTGTGTITVGQSGDTIDLSNPTSVTLNSDMKNTPAFAVNLTTTQSVSNSSETKVSHNNTQFDTNSGWTNYKYTIPTTGKYLVTHSVRFESVSAARVISWVRKNGSSSDNLNTMETNPNNSGVNPSTGGSFIYSFTANDYIEHYVFQNAGSSKNIEVGSNHLLCFFQATKLIGA
tara:strand:+ start:467 stop:1021 length:555 start_codon:yes stop_codon:yes gene_type:complete